jgi:hypothetical protein
MTILKTCRNTETINFYKWIELLGVSSVRANVIIPISWVFDALLKLGSSKTIIFRLLAWVMEYSMKC